MKNIFIILIFALLFFGCESDFLNTKPSEKISDANFWKTAADAKAGVTAIYEQMQHEYGIYGYNAMTDGITPNAYIWSNYLTSYQAISYGTLLPAGQSYSPFAKKWNGLFKGIFWANLAIEKLPGADINETLKNRLIGEARFLRALFYYNLADFFGGAPILKEILPLGAELPGRNTREEVISFVLSECDEAAKYLPTSYDATDVGRATKGAAITLKAKSYLLNNQFTEAAIAAKQVMDLGVYELYSDYEGMFTSVAAENNSEVIFDVQYIAPGHGEGSPLYGFFACRSAYGKCWNSCVPTVDLVDSYEMTNGKMITDQGSGYDPANPYDNRDPRLSYSVIHPGSSWKGIEYNNLAFEGGASKITGYLCRKHAITVDGYDRFDSPLNYIVFRYADVLLMYAEAKNEVSGPSAEVYSAINLVRSRPGVNMPPIATGKTQSEMRDIIRHERRIELAFEGIYYSDIRRWRIAKELNDGFIVRRINGAQLQVRSFVDAYYLWPVPQSERDLNPNLDQNPGY